MTTNDSISPLSAALPNTYDQSPEEREKYISSLEDTQKALEQRYANPNWFNVAAGFLKPQLGGFAASLGSASQALGENLEKQRANELTAAQYRTQVALMRNNLEQKAKGNAILKDTITSGGSTSPKTTAAIQAYGGSPLPEVAQGLQANEDTQRSAMLSQRASGMSEADLQAKNGPLFKTLFPNGMPTLPNIPGSVPMSSNNSAQTEDSVPAEFLGTPEEWRAKPMAAKNAFNSSLAEANRNTATETMKTYQAKAEAAQPKLDMLRGMRELASLPGMDKVFGILKDSDLVSLTAKAASEGRFGSQLSNAEDILRQANTPPELIAKVAELSKLINQSKISGGINATDSYRELNGAANPSLGNPQTAFIALTDATAHSAARDRDLYNLAQSKKPNGQGYNAATFTTEPAYKKYTNDFSRTHSDILLNAVRTATPSYYSASSASENNDQPKQASVPGKSSPVRSAPAGWEKQSDGSFKKVE